MNFRDQYARAREEQADKLFREIIEIADEASGDYVTTSDGKRIVDHENIQRSRLRVDARKWAAASGPGAKCSAASSSPVASATVGSAVAGREAAPARMAQAARLMPRAAPSHPRRF